MNENDWIRTTKIYIASIICDVPEIKRKKARTHTQT